MLLALGYCAKFAPLDTLNSRLEAHIASHFQATFEKFSLTKIDLRDCALNGLIEISRAIGKKGSKVQLSMRDEFLDTISSWVHQLLNQKKVDVETSATTCSLVLEACASLVAVVPKPDNAVIANVLGNTVSLLGSPFQDDKADVINLTRFYSSCVTVSPSKKFWKCCFSLFQETVTIWRGRIHYIRGYIRKLLLSGIVQCRL